MRDRRVFILLFAVTLKDRRLAKAFRVTYQASCLLDKIGSAEAEVPQQISSAASPSSPSAAVTILPVKRV
jgi:hypothetical protein